MSEQRSRRQWAIAAPGTQQGRAGQRVYQVARQPHRLGGSDALRAPSEHCLRTDVDPGACHLDATQFAADPIGAFQQDHVGVRSLPGDPIGSAQAGDPAADDDYPRHSEWTSSTTLVSTPGSVSGSTP